MKQNTYLSALLFAGLFLSLKADAAGECLGYAGSIVDFISFPAGTSCPSVTAKTVSGVECELVTVSDGTFACAIFPDDSQTIGGPWRYTGNPFGGETDPDPDPQPSPVITQPEPVSVPSDLPISDALTQFSYKMSAALGTIATNQWNLRAQANYDKSDILQRMGEYNTQSFGRDTSTRASVESLRSLTVSSFEAVETDLEEKSTENKELHEKTHAAQDVAQESLDKLPQLEIAVENARYHAQIAASTADSANYNAQQASNNAAEAAYNSGYVMGDIADTKNITSEIRNILLEGDTGGEGSQQTNDILTSIKADAHNNTDRIVNAVNNSNGLANIETQIMQTNGKLGGLSGQLGQQLDDIKTAIENSGGDGGSDDDTETNEKLDTIVDNTALTGNNVVSSGIATQQAVTASGQQVTEAVNGLGEKLDGIGQGIDGLADVMKPGTGQKSGPATCEGKDCWRAKSWIESPYPEGMKTIWDEHKQAFQDSSVTEYLAGFNPVINGATFESSWQLCFNFPTVNLGCHDLSIPPYILTFIRLLMLVSAGFLCRRLIFGG